METLTKWGGGGINMGFWLLLSSLVVKTNKQTNKSGLRSTWRILTAILHSPCMTIILLRNKHTESQHYQLNFMSHISSNIYSLLKTKPWSWDQPCKSWKKIWPWTFHLVCRYRNTAMYGLRMQQLFKKYTEMLGIENTEQQN